MNSYLNNGEGENWSLRNFRLDQLKNKILKKKMSQKNYSKKTFLPVYEEWIAQEQTCSLHSYWTMNRSRWILLDDWAKWFDEHKEKLGLCANEVFLPGCRLKVGFDLEQEGDNPFPEKIWRDMNLLINGIQINVLNHLYAAKQLAPPQ